MCEYRPSRVPCPNCDAPVGEQCREHGRPALLCRERLWAHIKFLRNRYEELLATSMRKAKRVDELNLDELALQARAWQDANFKNFSKLHAALQLCEESGEVVRAVLKEDLGVRPDTRGRVDEEIGDVLLAVLALADRHGLSAEECLRVRFVRLDTLDFTEDPEGGVGADGVVECEHERKR